MHRKSAVALLAVALVIGGVAGGYTFFTYYNKGSNSCPDIFSSVSYQNAAGFSTVAHPEAGITEYVLAPNSMGRLQVAYSSLDGNLTKSMFTGAVPVWLINTSTNTIQPTSSIHIQVSGIYESQDAHTVVVNYTISSGTMNALYLIGLPSTCHSLLLNAGTSTYMGSLPW